MTNKNSTFETWFRELEQLAKKLGLGVSAVPSASSFNNRPCKEHYERGLTPHEVLAKEMGA